MQTIKTAKFTSLILLSFLLISCGQIKELDKHSIISRFQKSESLYSASMRWGDWSTLLQLIKNKPKKADTEQAASEKKSIYDDHRALESMNGSSGGKLNILTTPTEKMLAYLETIKVNEVKVLSSGMSDVKEDQGSGKTLFEIVYHKTSSVRVHTIRHKVNWWYHKPSNSWFTDTPLPKEFQIPKSVSRTIKLSPK